MFCEAQAVAAMLTQLLHDVMLCKARFHLYGTLTVKNRGKRACEYISSAASPLESRQQGTTVPSLRIAHICIIPRQRP